MAVREYLTRRPVGDIEDALITVNEINKYLDIYTIYKKFSSKGNELEHVGTLLHRRINAIRKTDIESVFVMRGPYGTFGCAEAIEWHTYLRGSSHDKVERRTVLAFRMLKRCQYELEQIGIDVHRFKCLYNSEWIRAFEKAGYFVYHQHLNPSVNPFGLPSEDENPW